jgi:hypothetical protein
VFGECDSTEICPGAGSDPLLRCSTNHDTICARASDI